MSKAETLRGLITEKLAVVSREILAAVDRIVTEYEAEAAGFRREIDRQRRQLELKSGAGAAGGDEQPEEPEAGSSPTGRRCLSPRALSVRRRRSRPDAAKAENHVELRVQVLDGSQPDEISGDGSEVRRLRCPRGLKEEDFLRLLRSSFPSLEGDEPLDVLVANRKRKLWRLDLKVTTPEEVRRRIGSSTLYIRLCRHLRSDPTRPDDPPLSSASPEDFLCSGEAAEKSCGDADTSEEACGKESGDAELQLQKKMEGSELLRGETSDAVKEHLRGRQTDRPDADRKSFLCGVCGKSLSDQRSLSRHKMTHSGEKPHGCSVCGRRFKLIGTLKQHEKIHARRERMYLCDVCCKMFLTAKQLHVHMRQHTNEKPFRCAECGKDFTTRGPLTAHMRVHTGETPYRCPDCGWAFKRKIHLDNHMTVHSGVKPFVCGICGKACARKTYLTVHMRTHNGERPYKCTVCDKDFTQSHCLKTHMKSHQAT